MRDKKYCIVLDDFERRVIVNCLNEVRNKLIAEGKYTDAIDEVLLKNIDVKRKKFKVIYKEEIKKYYPSKTSRNIYDVETRENKGHIISH